MDKDNMYKEEIDAIKKHLSGEKKMTDAELEELGMMLETDIPYSDDWVMHGYSSNEEWQLENQDFLDKLDEVLELYRSIPEVKALKGRKATNYEASLADCNESNDVLAELGL